MDGTAIVLVLDGVRLEDSLGDGTSGATGEHPQALMPETWDQLLPQGTRASQAWCLGPTTTTPAHAALIAGRRLPLATVSADLDVGLYRPQLPSLFEAVRDQLGASEEQVVLAANTGLVKPVELSLWPGVEGADWLWVSDEDGGPAEDDRPVLAALQERLDEVPIHLALVNLHQIDRSGHYGGPTSHLDDIGRVDAPIAELWEWLQRHRDYRDDTTLVIISDHGRHSVSDDDPTWRHHGDACNGCRRVPALVLGPDVEPGVDLHDPFLLTDVAPTLAAVLGVELPWADGLAQQGLFTSPLPWEPREGLADLAVAGDLTAELRYEPDPAHRSSLWIGGNELSSPDALQVEAPALAREGEQAWACFREITLDPDGEETPWLAHCHHSTDGGASWEVMDTPVERVGPLWRPVLLPPGDGELLMAWVDNRAGTTDGGAVGGSGELHLVVSRYDGTWDNGWLSPELSYPVDVAAVLDGERLRMAVGASPTGAGKQHSRDVWLGTVSLDQGVMAWSAVRASNIATLLGIEGSWRMELPALRVDDEGVLHLAAVAWSDAGSHAILATSADGDGFDSARIVDLLHPVDPHLAPRWLGERAVWVTVDSEADESWLCAVGGEGEPECTSTGSPRVLRLEADGELWAVVDAGVGSWVLEGFEF